MLKKKELSRKSKSGRSARKPPRYWDDIAHVKQELRSFIEEHGTSGVMPTYNQLVDSGHVSLASAIIKHGGFSVISKQFGLKRLTTNKPSGYWKDFANVKRELICFIAEHGTAGVMPTANELSAASGDLLGAVVKHGGISAVAKRLGLKLSGTSKPSGYWTDFANVKKELHNFVAEHGAAGTMPTYTVLNGAKRGDLVGAIAKHGGVRSVAKKLGLQFARRPDGYWDDFANLENELLAFVAGHDTQGIMPTHRELKNAGRGDLVNAIHKHGGIPKVSTRLGLKRPDADKPSGYWDNFANVAGELRAYIAEHGKVDVMPTTQELIETKRTDLYNAVQKHGGLQAVAERLDWEQPGIRRPRGYWADFANIERELRDFITEQGKNSVMPTKVELEKAGCESLARAINDHGGFSFVARRLGLAFVTYEHVTSHTASSVERTARAIQPLAESNLLSPAQVMVILRRAGLLEFRNQRVVKLGASLARGDHAEIESAIANLVSGGEEIATETIAIEERDDLTPEEAEALLSGDLDTSQAAPPLKATTAPDVDRETAIIRGLSALGELRLPLDEVLILQRRFALLRRFEITTTLRIYYDVLRFRAGACCRRRFSVCLRWER